MRLEIALLATCLSGMLLSPNVYSQKKLFKYQQTELSERVSGDTLISFTSYIPKFEVRQPISSNGMTEFGIDTSCRAVIHFNNQSYLIDSLLFDNYSIHAGDYHFFGVYLITKKNPKFFIVLFADLTQMGTMLQPCYLIFQSKGTNVTLNSLYIQTDIEDNSGRVENTVCVYLRKRNIFLKGKNLELVKLFK